MAGCFVVMAGCFVVMAGCFFVTAGCFFVMAGCFFVMAGLDPAIPSRTVRNLLVAHGPGWDGRVKPGHDDEGPAMTMRDRP
jgi:hypothetical protein